MTEYQLQQEGRIHRWDVRDVSKQGIAPCTGLALKQDRRESKGL